MSIILFIAVLFVLILVHEWGHFIVAKKSGIRVDEFGIGFPPKAWGKKIGETEYTLNWLPIGGFVRIFGEDPTQEHYENIEDKERSFVSKPRYIQAAVLVAGVTMNIILAFILYIGAYMLGMPAAVAEGDMERSLDNPQLLVTTVMPDTPADAGLRASDEIIRVTAGDTTLDSADTLTPSTVSALISEHAGEEVVFELNRRNEPAKVAVVPQTGILDDEPERAVAGFTMTLVGKEVLPFHKAVVAAGVRTYEDLLMITVGLFTFLKDAIVGTADLSTVAGPVGIAGLVGDAAALGLPWLMTFTAFISLNLAVINLLPIPALDGGRLVFVGIEAITRKPIKPAFATRANQIGFVALLALMALVTVSDVVKLF